ncbi:MAG: malto-oligosyltrehalose trehalohydrolase [Actinobacteria bacterium]|nr:malto-oligosyltrehalose trehalohydrolase [Actinomycetota bacterium]
MSTFRVWAPRATQVEVEVDGGRVPMVPVGDRGWYETHVDGIAAGDGSDYRFVLDGSDALPDPRSAHQPTGVHGPSRLVDHGAFGWTDQRWRGIHLPSAVIYELHVGTFTPEGTFDGAVTRLDHLVDLGVDVVELLPVNEYSGSRGWGYDGVDLYAPHHAYGGPDGLKRLVDACHSRGLGVVMDVVYNHLGPAGNYLGRYGPYFTDRYATPWGEAVNLDGPGSEEVRSFFVDNAVMWLEDYHCDGLRLDAVHAIIDASAVHLLEQLSVRVEDLSAQLGRDLFLIAESDLNDPRVVRRREVGGYGIDAQWSDDFHHAIHSVLTGEITGYYQDFGTMAALATAFERAFVHAGEYSPYRGRRHGRLDPALGGHRFLGYSQNHDQVGNRAAGERTAAMVSTARLKVAAALVLTSPFVPLLFQGEEWGATTPFQYFTDHEDPDLGRAVSAGRRQEFAAFGWDPEDVPDPQDAATFERSKLDWSEPEREPHEGLLHWYRRLIQLRREVPELSDGRLDRVRTIYGEEDRWLVVERGRVIIACNLGAREIRLPLTGRLLAASDPEVTVDGATVWLPPDSMGLLRS